MRRLCAGGLQRRQNAEQQSVSDRGHEGPIITVVSSVMASVLGSPCGGTHEQDQPGHELRSRPTTAAADAEHEALGEQLPDQLAPARAERRARSRASSPGVPARGRDQQARHIGARDEQHEPDRRLDHEGARRARRNEVLANRRGTDVAPPLVLAVFCWVRRLPRADPAAPRRA